MPATGVRRTPKSSTAPTSLKLPAALKSEIDALAEERGISSHAFMVQTLAEAAQRARLRQTFQVESLEALHEMRETGKGYELDSVREYFRKLASHRQGKGPKPRRPAPVKTG
jgi:predicted transcriptional regulator